MTIRRQYATLALRTPPLRSALTTLAALGVLCVGAPSCGGSGGSSTGDTLTGVVLVDFVQASEDNVPLNRTLEFVFSSPIDPDTVGPASIQIRQGTTFGAAVLGRYVVQGSRVHFEPNLPGLCDLSDAGFQPGTDYRVTLIGSPEEFAIRNLAGQPLRATVSATFHTRPDSDPELFEDQIPGTGPFVASHVPADGAYPTHPDGAVAGPVFIGPSNHVQIVFSENLDPCTVTEDTVRFYQYARGSAGTMPTGFSPESDQTPGDPFSWGSGTSEVPARRVRSTQVLTQNFLGTTLDLVPVFGEFPDNALLAVTVTANVRDFGGNSVTLKNFAFVTENRASQNSSRVIEWLGETPVDLNASTGEVNTSRAPGRAQGFLLFAGDNDNGANQLRPAGPDSSNGPPGCFASFSQANDNLPDDFDTQTAINGQVNLDTGASRNTCTNSTDGSAAVVWEFRSFHIRQGHTVRIVGVNPAIILVQGEILIEAGGSLFVRGDGANGSPNPNGANGVTQDATTKPAGGMATAGGGDGGQADNSLTADAYSFNGAPGFASPSYGVTPAGRGGPTPVLVGAGRGNINTYRPGGNTGNANRNSPGGGGGGHAVAGGTGQSLGTGTNPANVAASVDGAAGSLYGDTSGKLLTPEAGSGGGGGGYSRPFTSSSFYSASGGAGGAGAGFLDLTSSGNIRVLGRLDAAGGRGGNGGNAPNGFASQGGGGGGGGSGGGIRVLTPQSIILQSTSVVTAIGGSGGPGGGGTPAPPNAGGNGGAGRLVFEDGDSVITGYSAASVLPPEGSPAGFFRGVFDASRFVGGGLKPMVVTGLVDMGPYNPTYAAPVQNYGIQEDFLAGVTNVASLGLGRTGIFVEIQGYSANPDGTPNLGLNTGWRSVGYFTDSGSELFPTWNLGTPPDVTPLPDNTGGSITSANGRQFCQFRFTFFLKDGIGPFDPGHYVDRWTVRFSYDQ